MLSTLDYREFSQITFLDEIEEQRPLSSEEKLRKDAPTVELEKTILLEEVSWKNSRALWLKEG